MRGVDPDQVVKTLVVRRGKDDYLFVLVPGDRQISWPQLRTLLDVTRLSMPDAQTARAVTGYERGTITPFGALRPWPVIADVRVQGTNFNGGGAHGEIATANATDAIEELSPTSPRHKHAQGHELRSPRPAGTDRAPSAWRCEGVGRRGARSCPPCD